VDIEAEEYIEHVSDKEKEKELEDDRRSYITSMHCSTLNVFITLWTLICVSNFMLYFNICPKTSISRFSAMSPSMHFFKPR
jgi:hypothetical protein